ncbi:MAG: SDR family NAD(P)-dependent oxidoreductase [Gammaproteobacteria bacterium]
MLLKGKNAVITGSNRGIGKAILTLFAENGANIWACARQPSNDFEMYLTELSSKYGVEICSVYFDFQNQEQVKAAIKAIMATKRSVDVLVNNAGVTYNALFQMSTADKMQQVFDINFFSQMIFTQFIIKLMLRTKKGSIVNIASTAGLDGNPGRSVYGASKAALICATKAMSSELGEGGIRVNAIAPGVTQTEMLSSMTAEVINATVQQSHLKRVGEPVEIAKAALFLASDMSSYVTGQVLRVDGGGDLKV